MMIDEDVDDVMIACAHMRRVDQSRQLSIPK